MPLPAGLVKLVCMLVGGNGVRGVDFVIVIDEKSIVEQLKNAIKAKLNDGIPTLIHCSASCLQLFLANKARAWLVPSTEDLKALRNGELNDKLRALMDEDKELPGGSSLKAILRNLKHLVSGQMHILVVDPTRRPVYPREWRVDLDQQFILAHDPYKVTADHLKDHEIVDKLSCELARVVAHGVPTPFVVLENSSGTGKTQMGFNLQAHGRWGVIHIVCSEPADNDQHVYHAFASRSDVFRTCAQGDLAQLQSGSISEFLGKPELLLYGFIAAVLRGDATFSAPAQRSDVEKELILREKRGAKPCVFFWTRFRDCRRVLSLRLSRLWISRIETSTRSIFW